MLSEEATRATSGKSKVVGLTLEIVRGAKERTLRFLTTFLREGVARGLEAGRRPARSIRRIRQPEVVEGLLGALDRRQIDASSAADFGFSRIFGGMKISMGCCRAMMRSCLLCRCRHVRDRRFRSRSPAVRDRE